MSYRKISDGNQTIKISETMITSTEKIEFEQPMSYISCPNCNSDPISCNCFPVNYYCMECNWKYITHNHMLVGGRRQAEALFLCRST